MNNVEIYIVVEGQTEQTFVRHILAPDMAGKGFFLHAALIGKPGHKGAISSLIGQQLILVIF